MSNSLLKYINNNNLGSNIDIVPEYTTSTQPNPATLENGSGIEVDNCLNLVSGSKYVPIRYNNNTFAVIGDSYSNNMTSYSTATSSYWNDNSFLTHAFMRCGRRVNLTYFGAVGGTGYLTGTNTFDKQLDSAIASGAKNLIVMGGFNDVHTDKGIDAIIAACSALLNRAIRAGMRLFICTQPGPSSGYYVYSYNHTGQMDRLNTFLRHFFSMQSRENCVLVDCAAVAIDPASTSMSYRPGYASTDSVHPLNLGSHHMGKVLADAIVANVPAVESLSFSNYSTYSYNSNCTNFLTNGLFIDTSSAGVASGWTTSVDAGAAYGTRTLVPKSNNIGNVWTIPCTFTTAGAGVKIQSTAFTTIQDGDEFYFEGEISLGSPVSMKGISVQFTLQAQSQTKHWFGMNHSGITSSAIPDADVTYEIKSPVIKYDAATMGPITAGCTVQIMAFGASTSSSCNLLVSQCSIRKVIKG